jgi:hypothetical protein
MIRISDNPPPGTIDRRDGNTKGEVGLTTKGCLFCKDQISGSGTYVRRYDEVAWAGKDRCQVAICPFWGTTECQEVVSGKKIDPKESCSVYRYRQLTGRWEYIAEK